ncbi:MAG: hypothetical protein K2Y22_04150 [Candidatus Obscuribacterales bacterium]|nr:hypothetical protein [Candidatus Obscuribacterales bacterium]
MKVKMNTTMAGPDGVVLAGKSVEVDEEFGAELVKGGYAVSLDGKRKVKEVEPEESDEEKAVLPGAPEKRVKK